MFKKLLKSMFIGIGILFVVGIVVVVLFTNLSPQFGASLNKEQKTKYSTSANFKNEKFLLQVPINTAESTWGMMKKFWKNNPKIKPNKPIVPLSIDSLGIVNYKEFNTQLTWFGHSTFLVQMDEKNILLDPMFGDYASPLPLGMAKRFSEKLPISVEQLPFIDFVIFSHDHYDHLDYGSVKMLKDKVGVFYVPLGLSAHLISWGVDKNKIKELDWWESINFEHIKLVCTPAIHFSGRGFFDRAATLWCSWVIEGKNDKIYFSGDSGYGNHFKEIGERFGPFDIALMECGQYDQDWKYIHMFPEETAQATKDVKGKLLIPIHWGGFKLGNHDWTDPIVRVIKKAKELDIPISTPRVGESIILKKGEFPNTNWWTKYD